MAKIGQIDIDCVTTIQRTQRKSFNDVNPTANLGIYAQNMINELYEIRIEGFLENPTQSIKESIEALRNSGRICLIDLDDVESGLITWGKMVSLDWIDEERYADILQYEMIMRVQPAVGLAYIRTSNAYLLDLDQKAKYVWLDPHYGRCNKSYNTNRTELEYTIKIKNYSSSSQDVLLEIQVADNLSSLSISPSSGWSQATGTRGESVATGTISRSLGCNKRVLLKRTFAAETLLTETITITHSAHPDGNITYVEGGLNP